MNERLTDSMDMERNPSLATSWTVNVPSLDKDSPDLGTYVTI